MDAAHFVHGAFLCYLWSVARLFLRTPSGRQRFNVLGALDFASREVVTLTNLTYITSTTVCELLRLLAAQHPGIPITLVLDNARYQRCRLVQDLAAELGIERIRTYSKSFCKEGDRQTLLLRLRKMSQSPVVFG